MPSLEAGALPQVSYLDREKSEDLYFFIETFWTIIYFIKM